MPAVHTGRPELTGTLVRQMPPGATSALVPALNYWRRRRAWTQQELADNAAVSLISVQRAEAGQPLRLRTIRNLAKALHVGPDELMTAPPAAE